MSHNNHSCQCEHEDVRYCKGCKLVYCRDCNQEWRTQPVFNYGYQYPWYSYINGQSSLTGGNLGQIQGNTNTPDDGYNPTVTACGHGSV